jgi:hypothetical protein
MADSTARRLDRLRPNRSLESIAPGVAAWIEAFARGRAVGLAPELLAFAILQVTLSPSLERAADFATDAVDGRLSRSLAAHRLAAVSGAAAFEAFADEWADQDPSLRRAVTLLTVAMDAPADRRADTLENALTAVLDGARDRVVEYATAIRGPAMGIYAFGVMLPLALVGLLPVLASSGGGVSTLALAVAYDGVIPIGLAGSGLWLWARRPAVSDVAFDVGVLDHARSVPIVLAAGVSTAVAAWIAVPLLAPAWVAPITATGVGAGTALVLGLDPVLAAQRRIERLEARLPDALTIVGQRLEDGEPIETTIGSVAERFDGPIGDLLARAATRHRRTGAPMERTLLGPDGLLGDVPSRRVEAAFSLATTAAEHGPSGGVTLRSVGEYLEELLTVERDARRELSQTTSTLRQTALVFAPAIAGVTVALATGMGAVDGSGRALDVAALGQVIGVYVLSLAIVLPALSVVLARGFDPVRMGYQSGLALAVGGIVYPLCFVAARSLVYV